MPSTQASSGVHGRLATTSHHQIRQDLFTKTFNPALLQAIAMKVKLDAFVRVKKAIDDMITQLTAEKQDKIKHKNWSGDELCQESFSCSKCARLTSRRV